MSILAATLAAALAAAPPATPPAAAAPPPTLTLEEALRELDAQNLTLAQARARAEAARAVVRQSASALLPTLTAAGSYTANRDQAAVAMPAGKLYIQPYEVFEARGTVRLPLVVPSAWFDLAAAGKAAEAAEASAAAARLDIRAAFAQSSWLAAMGEDVVAASERAVAAARDQEQTSRRAVAAGTAAPLSVLQARTVTARRESELVQARSELDRARLALGVFLGRSGPVRVALPAAAPPATPPDADALAGEALSLRPELRAGEAQVASAERQLSSARWRWLPQLSASGSIFAADVAYPTGYKDGWRLTVDLTWPLYDGGYRYGKAREARAALSGAEAARALERLQVGEEVQNAVRDVAVARERVRLGERQQEAAAEAAASARRSFAAGVAGSIEVLDANDRLFQAEVGLAEARARLGTAQVALDRAVGRSP